MVRLEIGRDTIKVFMAAVSSLMVEHYDLLSGGEIEKIFRHCTASFRVLKTSQ